jgi:hypothetical protein
MSALTREAPDRYRIRFEEVARTELRGFRRGDPVQVDPFLIARAIAEVIARARSGRRRGSACSGTSTG